MLLTIYFCSKMYEKYQEAIGVELKASEKIEVESLLRDESVDEEGLDTDIVDREQERREREEKMLELKQKSERVCLPRSLHRFFFSLFFLLCFSYHSSTG
jgi:hypothetical protein